MIRCLCYLLALLLLPVQGVAQADVRTRVAAMPAGVAGQIDLFVISLAGDGKQWLFSREAKLALERFDARYGSGARSLLLANTPTLDLNTPIASQVTVQTAIAAMAARMNRDEDILLLYLTSHGWKDGTIALSSGFEDLPPLSAQDVDGWLRQAGIVRSVIVVSACYSGSWAPALATPNRILLMAARPDRSSFGCSDERDLTFFGQALFAESMNRGEALLPAFENAKRLIADWEAQGKLNPSQPQRAIGAALLPVWLKLEAGLGAAAQVAATTAPPPLPPRCKRRTC
jgi:hypothetical protein